jgi:chloramphenicol 3-O phosphotransferase
MATNGRIILLNGTSSAGKSILAKALRPRLEPQFCFYASDQLADADFRPIESEARTAGRKKFFEGFHRSIPTFAAAGLDLLVEHIVEEQSWADDLAQLLALFDTFWVGVHAPLSELERREQLRGDRQIGEAAYHLKTHSFCKYDVEVDSMQPLDQNVNIIVDAWKRRLTRPPG